MPSTIKTLKYLSQCLLLCGLFLATTASAQVQFGPAQLIYNAGFSEIPERVAAADLDGDGDIDILTKKMFDNPIFWMANDGQGNFTHSGIELAQSDLPQLQNLLTLDYDKDGDQDIVAVFSDWQSYASYIYLWENFGSGVFSSRITLGSGFESVESLFVTDYDNDNDPDVLVGSSSSEGQAWLENNFPVKSWTKRAFTDSTLPGTQYRAADMDNNGTADLITVHGGTNSVKINGQPIVTNVYIGWPKFLEVADIDGDADPDIIAGTRGYDDGVVLIRNNGNGQFSTSILENTEDKEINAIALLDYDGDGDLDLFAGCWLGCGLSLYENTGAARFSFKGNIGSGAMQEYELLIADLNNDGRQDLVRTNGSSHVVQWHPNTTAPFDGIEAGFIYSGSCFKEDIRFEHTVRGRNTTSLLWNFGDGQTSTAQSPSHRYTSPGAYEVILTATNIGGQSHSTRHTIQVIANPSLPNIDLQYCTFNTYETKTVTLDPAYTYKWFLNSWDSETTPFHTGSTYTRDFYSYSQTELYVTATSSSGCVSERFTVTTKPSSFPLAPYTEGNISYNGPAELKLTAQSATAGTTMRWFSDDASQPFYTGSSLTRMFSSNTTLYVNAINAAGCESDKVPVTASIFPAPVPPPSYVWADLLDAESTTEGRGMTRDNNGNFVVLGSWGQGEIKAGQFTLAAGPDWNNRFIVTYDKNGVVQNAFKLFSAKAGWLEYNEILVDHENNFYFTADVMGERILVGDQTISLPLDDVQRTVIIKTDPAGVLLWHKVYPYSIRSSRMVIDHNNEVVLHGVFQHSVTVEGTTLYATDFSGFVAKLHEDGSLSWIQKFPLILDADLAIDDNNTIYIGGSMYDAVIDFGPTTVTKNAKALNTAVVIKFTPEGACVKARDVLETNSVGSITGIEVDSHNDLVIYGNFTGATTIGGNYMSGGGAGEIYLMKYDSDLQLKWAQQFVGNGQEVPWDLTLDEDDNIYVTGAYWHKLSIMGLSFSATTPKLHYQFAAKFNSAGIVQWARDADLERFASCEADDEGGLFVSGTFRRMTRLDQLELNTATNLGNNVVNSNIFTTKLDFSFNSHFKVSGSTCKDTEIRFEDWSTVKNGESIVSWSWDFGDGATSQQQHASHAYAAAGGYTVTLDVVNNLGQPKSFTSQIVITSITKPSIIHNGNTAICSGQNISLSGPAGFASYWWSDGVTERVRTTTQAGDYQLKVANALGCWSPYSQAVTTTVNLPPAPVSIIEPAAGFGICPEKTLELAAPAGYLAYEWGDGMTGRSRTIASTGGFKVKVANQPGCWSLFSSIVNITMHAAPAPVVITAPQAAPVLCPDQSVQLTAPSGHPAYEWSDGTTASQHVVNKAGDYNVKVSNARGCWSSVSNTIRVTRQSAPSPVTLSPSELVLCPGKGRNLVAPANHAAYLWNTGASQQSIVVTSGGAYAVKVANASGCWSDFSQPANVSVAVVLTPVISALVPNKLSASNGTLFSWFLNNVNMNLHTQEIEVTKSGDYTVEVTDNNGCAALSALHTLNITGISKKPERSGIVVYPNPTKASIYVVSENTPIQQLEVFNQLGQKLLTLPGSFREIDLSMYAEGIYVVAAQTTDGVVILKVNKIH